MVALFGTRSGRFSYRLEHNASEYATVFGPARVIRGHGAVRIEAVFDAPEAAIVFFGANH